MSPSPFRSELSNAWENVRVLAGAVSVLVPTMAGCTVSPSDSVDAESAAQSSAAIVIVERTAGPGDAVHGDDVVARFVRVQGSIDDATLRVVGVSTEIPAVGTCADVEGNGGVRATGAGAAPARGVELLDVGAVTLEDPQTTGKNTELLPRVMPDPAGIVSGVIYSARANDAFTPGSGLRLRASGGPDATEGFVAQFNAPRDVTNARVTVGAGGVDVTWDAGDADPRDLVYVELLTPASTTVRRCTSLDAGHLFVKFGDATSALDEGQVVVHRLRREPFQGKGVPDGEVRFDVARILTYTR